MINFFFCIVLTIKQSSVQNKTANIRLGWRRYIIVVLRFEMMLGEIIQGNWQTMLQAAVVSVLAAIITLVLYWAWFGKRQKKIYNININITVYCIYLIT